MRSGPVIQKGSYRSPMVGWVFAPYAREYEYSSIAIAAASAGAGTGGSASAVSAGAGTGGSASAVSATPTVPAAGIAHPAVGPGHRGPRPGHGLHRQHGPRTGRARRHRRDTSRHGSRLCVGESRCGRTGCHSGRPAIPASPARLRHADHAHARPEPRELHAPGGRDGSRDGPVRLRQIHFAARARRHH